MVTMINACIWTREKLPFYDGWSTSCGMNFEFWDGSGPADNWFVYCPFCGVQVIEKKLTGQEKNVSAISEIS